MKTHQFQERTWIEDDPILPVGKATPLITFRPVYFDGTLYRPDFGDRASLLILSRKMPKRVSFLRAYSGWRAGGKKDLQDLGEGRAFFRWLQRHELSIQWRKDDFTINNFFTGADSPRHDPGDEYAQGLSFALNPIRVGKKRVKLYLEDQDVISLLRLGEGLEIDFVALTRAYISMRLDWDTSRAQAPGFLDWVRAKKLRPTLQRGQLGFTPPVEFVR